ncbi:MAG: PepSY domain-containing protein, partial [Planctomycetota bacterium]
KPITGVDLKHVIYSASTKFLPEYKKVALPPPPVISEKQAIAIAKRAVKSSFTKQVPEDAELQVILNKGRYEIAFLRPRPKVPVPSSGYYVMIWVDAIDGTPTVLGEP